MKILLLGTSRLHRAFAFNDFGILETNFIDGINVVYPRAGYFHSIREIEQVTKWLFGRSEISAELSSYVFRREPENTTPLNEFCPGLLASIEAGSAPSPTVPNIHEIDVLVVEISTLLTLKHAESGIFLHSHPNLPDRLRSVKLKKWGDYAHLVDFVIVRRSLSRAEIIGALQSLQAIIGEKRVIIMGHLHETVEPNPERLLLNETLRAACDAVGVTYFDPRPYVDKYGFRRLQDVVDIHHLSHEGEFALGRGLQDTILA